jgi:predicted nucleic acid-binding protein
MSIRTGSLGVRNDIALADLQKALQVFRDYSDHLFSFVACTSFAVMERLGINHAFAFDSHFDEYSGIIRVPR